MSISEYGDPNYMSNRDHNYPNFYTSDNINQLNPVHQNNNCHVNMSTRDNRALITCPFGNMMGLLPPMITMTMIICPLENMMVLIILPPDIAIALISVQQMI